MAQFLNTTKLNYWIPKLIQEAEKELILIVPYIQTSDNIFKSLKVADERDIEIILVYRENKLSIKEKNKLLSLGNINLLHHPNIHCKCYFNGNWLIVGSMNLYDYSEKNNREMGVLFSNDDIEEKENKQCLLNAFNFPDDDDIFIDAINEIREIVNGSSAEKVSERTKSSSFEIEIIKTDQELEIERCNEINNHFLNKKFKPFENSKDEWFSRCDNFFDKVDVIFHHHRLAITLNLNEKQLKGLYKEWMKTYDEFEFKGFKYYWNYYSADILVYRDYKYDWDSIEEKEKLYYKKLNEGINLIIKKYRSLTGK
ncbi:phospholipase D family protein [Flavivirga spongiicola]|uniref:Phospholipase D family protein n=1 Tax=Flavivirga spongiicola TaxID=421621 RepID=A0ABU7XTV7_9FLAO|nr:phospholipase D family protein [Flavivirga sp. MEBiC05379]MDO5979209.1 phospholipase D family protein [Flavivirga sp. MEBiC05379]